MLGVLPNGERAPRGSYIFGASIAAIDEADMILLVGTNPRIEAPVLNARIRKRYLQDLSVEIGVIGPKVDLSYETRHLGHDPSVIGDIEPAFLDRLSKAKKPMIIAGAGAFVRGGAGTMNSLLTLAAQIGALGAEQGDWNGLNVLHSAAARVGGLDIGFLPGEGGKGFSDIISGAESGDIDVVYNLGADEFDTDLLKNAFVIYQGHHGDAGARVADVILPGAAYTEESGTFVNTEGRVQLTNQAYHPFGEAKANWAILRALSQVLGQTLPYDDLFAVRQAMIEDNEVFGAIGTVSPVAALDQTLYQGAADGDAAFVPPFTSYWLTNPIARASETMRECHQTFVAPQGLLAAE